MVPLMDLGIGKSATAHMIQYAALSYKDQGYKSVFPALILPRMKLTRYRFYYADERKADGSAAYFDIDGDAHGKLYTQLAEGKSQEPWLQTFVKGVGYKHFSTS